MRSVVALMCAATASAFVPRSVVVPARMSPLRVDADCVESESCSVEELADLLADVKSKAAEINPGAQCSPGASARADGRFYAAKLVGTGRCV